MTDKEIKEAKSLRWLAVQFPKVENPKDDIDRMQNCINLYCTNAAELINRQQAEIERLKNTWKKLIDKVYIVEDIKGNTDLVVRRCSMEEFVKEMGAKISEIGFNEHTTEMV